MNQAADVTNRCRLLENSIVRPQHSCNACIGVGQVLYSLPSDEPERNSPSH